LEIRPFFAGTPVTPSAAILYESAAAIGAASKTKIVTVVGSLLLDPSVTLYVNVSSPEYFDAGRYENDPFLFNRKLP
jgi:hypothetical protein